MQEKLIPFLIDNNTIGNSEAGLVEEDLNILSDVEDVAEMVTGYGECMAEAVRYLTEVEKYPLNHPAVQALRSHLAGYRSLLLTSALRTTLGKTS